MEGWDRLPTEEECLGILRGLGTSDNVIEHILSVKRLAVKMAELAGADVELVCAGAMLHDAGRSVTHGITHAVEGKRLLEERGLPGPVIDIVKKHIGAGILPEEAAILGLPPDDYIPRTLEEKIVAHADNLAEEGGVKGLGPFLALLERINLPQVAERARAMHEELCAACGVDLEELL
jgi:uncharacterized protein (TIGR00295 family)